MSQMDQAPTPLPPEEQTKLVEAFIAQNFSSFEELISGLRRLEQQGVKTLMGSHGKPHELSSQIQKLEEFLQQLRRSAESPTRASDAQKFTIYTIKKFYGITELIAKKLMPLMDEYYKQ